MRDENKERECRADQGTSTYTSKGIPEENNSPEFNNDLNLIEKKCP